MLCELAVRDLGVIEDLRLVLEPGMTALTGETGAGKTLVVEAIELLLGGRADSVLVRSGAAEAIVEGRFERDGDEVVLSRCIPAEGRSRAYVDGRMATAATLAEIGRELVDLHGQHAHQSLLAAAAQRDALDRFAAVDLGPLRAARAEVAALEGELAGRGGDAGARAREIDLLRFQLAEISEAAIAGDDEDERLDAEEDALVDVVAHREAAAAVHEVLTGEGGALDSVGSAVGGLAHRAPFADSEARLRLIVEELSDIAAAVRDSGDALDDDPDRLTALRERRQLLAELRRKYGSASLTGGGEAGPPTLAGVLAYAGQVDARLDELERQESRAAVVEEDLARARGTLADRAAEVGEARRKAAPALAAAVEHELRALAMPKARLSVEVGAEDPGDAVRFLLAANPGTEPLPLTKVASGGELARAMLALRLVLTAAPDTLVFDEVDAGIGGEAAVAVGRALARLGEDHQVLVVTHLPQVAAAAHRQVGVSKAQTAERTVTSIEHLDGDERVVEISRMLSGSPDSAAARSHARELLEGTATGGSGT